MKSENSGDNLSHDHYKALGDEHTRARRFQQAEESYTWAISVEYKQHATWGNRSLVRLKLGNKDGACSDALRCTELAADWPKGWARLGAAERARNHSIMSVKAYRRAHELEPTNKEFIRLLNEVEIEYQNSQLTHHNHHNHQHQHSASLPPLAQHRKSSLTEASTILTHEDNICEKNQKTGNGEMVLTNSNKNNKSIKVSTTPDKTNKNNEIQTKPLPRLIPMRVLEVIKLSLRNHPGGRGGIWHWLGKNMELNKNGVISDHENNSMAITDNLPSLGAIQTLMSQCLEQLPLKERVGLDSEEQLTLMMSTLESSPCQFPQLERLVSNFSQERNKLTKNAKKIVPKLPISMNEHWCCICCDSPTLKDVKTGKPVLIITVAVLDSNNAKEGTVLGSEQNNGGTNATGGPSDGLAVLDILYHAMAFPVPSMPPPRRPVGILLCHQLIQHYAIIAREMLALDIACRIESKIECETQRINYDRQHHHHHHHHHQQHHHNHQQHQHGTPPQQRQQQLKNKVNLSTAQAQAKAQLELQAQYEASKSSKTPQKTSREKQ